MVLLGLTIALMAALFSITMSTPITPYLDFVGGINGKVFLANRTEAVSAALAQRRCHENNGTLGRIDNAEENQLITNYMVNNGIAYFVLDGSDYPGEGDWHWVSNGENMNYTNWNDTEPNGGRSSNCMYISSSTNGRWSDLSCEVPNSNIRSLCQLIVPGDFQSDVDEEDEDEAVEA